MKSHQRSLDLKKTVPKKLGVVLKGYPRLSETFIAQELHALEKIGIPLHIYSLRPPRDLKTHPVHQKIEAQITYLPETLTDDIGTFLRATAYVLLNHQIWPAFKLFLKDSRRSLSADRLLRLLQSFVIVRESGGKLLGFYAHFLHTPASVTRYAARILDLKWTCSAHAVDIWTQEDWEKSEKLSDMEWLVTCTQAGHEHLSALTQRPDKVNLVYHGLDLENFPAVERETPYRDGSQVTDPVRLLSVGRLVEKKGFPVLLRALSELPPEINWRWEPIGDGQDRTILQRRATDLGINDRINWRGACTQEQVRDAYRRSDIFVLPSVITGSGDRDGLPNVLLEAQSQGLACLSTHISGIPELIETEVNGLLVAPDNHTELRDSLLRLIKSPELREQLGEAGRKRVAEQFEYSRGIRKLAKLFSGTYPELSGLPHELQ